MQVSCEKERGGNRRREAFSLSGCGAEEDKKKSVFFTIGKWHVLYLNPATNVFF